ncbi:MAG TPA: hypothetical protein P5277_02735 [Candidatus Paceibacterota bacterium]|nr:hypothetical protein [Candidatus Paceibacterota bacterium]
MTKKIRANLIIEILGKPPEHIIESLKVHIENISKERGIKLIDKTIHDAKKLEKGELYTSFAEIDVEFENFESLIGIIFSYMPSHIEIVEPETLTFENLELSNLLTAIMIKLHRYDEIAKRLYMDNSILQKELKNITELIKQTQEKDEIIPQDTDNKNNKSKKKKV